MKLRDVNLAIRKNFGNRQNFLIWLVLLGIALLLFNNYTENAPDTNVHSKKYLPFNPAIINKHRVKKRCDQDSSSCPVNSYSYLITSGEGNTFHPAICFNGDYLLNVDKNNSRRGINVAVINDKTLDVEDIRIFDTYISDEFFKEYFSTLIPSNFIVLIASFDDITYRLSDESRVLLESFGSNVGKQIKFRDSFVMLGQKNLKRGHAVEKLSRGNLLEYASRVEIKGCTKVPVGELEAMNGMDIGKKKKKSGYKPGEALINCGVSDVCDDTSFSFHAYTGDGRGDICKLCINGKYIFAKDLNWAGRGFNVAVVSPMTRDVIKIGVFDTYSTDGTNAEIFLEMLNDKDIVIVVTYDDASRLLTVNVQKFFEDLGSVMINRLSFRDSWVFVGQKGISGMSPIEKMNRAGDAWPEAIDWRMCVPIQLEGIKVGKFSEVNKARKRFCDDHKDVMEESFCAPENQSKFFEPATFVHADKRIHNDIYRTPIIIIPGSDYRAFQVQIDNLLKNPGIRLDMINLIHSGKHKLYTDLSEVYGIRSHSLYTHITNYGEFFPEAFRRAWSMYKSENHMIFLEEEIIPTSDFLSFLARCTNTNYYIDNSLVGISTWNPYGGPEGLAEVWYRTNATLPGVGFMMKRLFYMNYINDVISRCCYGRPWLNWKIPKLEDKEIIVPSVSRSYRLPFKLKENTKNGDSKMAVELFNNRNRSINRDFSVEIESPNSVISHKYERYVTQLINSSLQYEASEVMRCIDKAAFSRLPPQKMPIDRFSIYYEQKSANDTTLCLKIAKCFNYSPISGIASSQQRNGLLRLTYYHSEVFLIGSMTKAFKLKPPSAILYKMSGNTGGETKVDKTEGKNVLKPEKTEGKNVLKPEKTEGKNVLKPEKTNTVKTEPIKVKTPETSSVQIAENKLKATKDLKSVKVSRPLSTKAQQ